MSHSPWTMAHRIVRSNRVKTYEKLLNSPKKTDEDELMEDSESTNQNANNSIDNIDDRIEDEIMSSQEPVEEINSEMPPLVEQSQAGQSQSTNDNQEVVATDVDMENELDYSETTIEEVKSPNQTSKKPTTIAPSESEFEPHSEFESTVAEFAPYNVARYEYPVPSVYRNIVPGFYVES